MKRLEVNGIPFPVFAFVFVIVVVGTILGVIPDNLGGGFALCLILGMGMMWIGDQVPVLSDYGLGTILAVIVPAVLVYAGILPERASEIEDKFLSGYDFTSFLVPGLLVGSILAMDKKVLVNAGARFIIPMILTILFATLISGLVGALMGYGMTRTMLYIAGPILGSGVSASAVPLSEIYAGYSGENPADILTVLTSSVMVANVLTILIGSILAALGRKNPNMFFKGFAGSNGRLLRSEEKIKITEEQKKEVVKDPDATSYSLLRTGFVLTCGIFIASKIIAKYMPGGLHFYLYMIIIAVILKLTDVLPPFVCEASGKWTSFMSKIMTPCALCAISLGVLDIGELTGLFENPSFLIFSILCVLITTVVSGFLCYAFGFYFIEGAIMAGLGLADMGGTGDVAVLSAAKRMELLPFLTICSRIGGAINMVWLTFLASMVL